MVGRVPANDERARVLAARARARSRLKSEIAGNPGFSLPDIGRLQGKGSAILGYKLIDEEVDGIRLQLEEKEKQFKDINTKLKMAKPGSDMAKHLEGLRAMYTAEVRLTIMNGGAYAQAILRLTNRQSANDKVNMVKSILGR